MALSFHLPAARIDILVLRLSRFALCHNRINLSATASNQYSLRSRGTYTRHAELACRELLGDMWIS